VSVPRRLYLVVIAVTLVVLLAGGLYVRHQAKALEKAAAECDTPAPPPKPATPPPQLPGFEVAAACGTGDAAKPPAGKPK
jgi:hypothetical protein